jgi:hypothetical protein
MASSKKAGWDVLDDARMPENRAGIPADRRVVETCEWMQLRVP